MTVTRKPIARSLRTALLKEFHHRCAICGVHNPQIHHIDEDPGNNAPSNLIPLCPNCHLIDQHDPTRPIHPDRLALFRRFRDPSILAPGFEPVFRRLQFVVRPDSIESYEHFKASRRDLLLFVKVMSMGEYYAARLEEVTSRGLSVVSPGADATASQIGEVIRLNRDMSRTMALNNAPDILALVVEMLRYQAWADPASTSRPTAT